MLHRAGAAGVSGGELLFERSAAEPPRQEPGGEGVAGAGGVADAVERDRRGHPRLWLPEHFGAFRPVFHDHERSGVRRFPEDAARAVVELRFLRVHEDPGGAAKQLEEPVAPGKMFVVAEVPEHLRHFARLAHGPLQLRPPGADIRRKRQQHRAEGRSRAGAFQVHEDPPFESLVRADEGGEAPFRAKGETRRDRMGLPRLAEIPVADALGIERPSHPRRKRREEVHFESFGPGPGDGDERAAAEGAAERARADLFAGAREPGQPGEDEVLEGFPGDQKPRRRGVHDRGGYRVRRAPACTLPRLVLRQPTPAAALWVVLWSAAASGQEPAPDFHDAHFHTTNYIQREIALPALLEMMGERVGRAALMGIPLQQKWDFFESGDRAPDYYLRADAALYYYPFVDAMLAEAVRALPPEQRARFDPMITGFNPTDMYATDHIRRVLRLYPGVFTGIGEFSVHKEVVTPKTVGHTASLGNPALGRILQLAGEVGLVVLIHNDVDVILPREGARPTYLDPFVALVRAHPETTVVWAHAGIGRFVEPAPDYPDLLEALLRDDSLAHLHFDLSWDVVAEQIVSPPETLAAWAALLDGWPDRFLLGSDSVIPGDREAYLSALHIWRPLLDGVAPGTSHKVRLGNYERLFDEARLKVRAWEAAGTDDACPAR